VRRSTAIAAIPPHLCALSESERCQLEGWLADFDLTWAATRLSERAGALPPGPLREAALVEMVKIDLERRWQRGERPAVEDYLRAFPELGTPDTVAADLLLAECEVRQQCGEPPDAARLAQRFPGRAEEVLRLVAQTGPHDPEANRETARPGPTLPPAGRDGPLAPGERFGRYQVLRCLGQGGMGAVYLAHDSLLDRPVALKVPRAEAGDEELLTRFHREARAAAQLAHPNLCPVHDVGVVGGISYLTMAYVEGQSLAERLAGGPPPTSRESAGWIRTCALALAEAHRCGVIHRDLKPSNIMLDRRGQPVILDFGLARRVETDARLTHTGMLVGTPAYMAPEQVRGEVAGPACDVYALGVILYELLAGRPPFEGPVGDLLVRAATDSPPPPSAHRPGVDARLEAICLKAMARDVARRWAGMDELAEALTRYLESGSTAPSPAFSALRKHRLWLVGGAAAAGLLLTVALWSGLGRGRGGVPPERGQARQDADVVAEVPAVLQPLLANLTTPDDRVRLDAAGHLAGHRHPASVQALCKALSDEQPAVRRRAAESLGKQGDPEAVPALMQRVADELWLTERFAPEPGEALARWLSDPRAGGKGAALDALQALAPGKVPEALRKALRARSPLVRGWAARELAAHRHPSVAHDLAGALADESGYVRRSAAESLGKLTPKETDDVVPALVKRVADDVWVAPYFGSDDGAWAGRTLQDPEAGGKAAALRALEKLAPDRVDAALSDAQRSKSPDVRAWAATERNRRAGKK
jgi:HEAT repeat protein